MTTVTDFFVAGLEQVRKSWGWFLMLGILLMVLGGLCIGKAQTATTFSILALGWVLAIRVGDGQLLRDSSLSFLAFTFWPFGLQPAPSSLAW